MLRKLSLQIVSALIAALAALFAAAACADTIVAARYESPVERYGHYALGRPHEYARLVAATESGRELALELPQSEVFEDLAPRLIKLAADEPAAILAIVSSRDSGTRLVLVELRGGRLEIGAQSAPTGTPKRWLNPVGVADLNDYGRAEIAAVITPHIGGTLKVYRRSGRELVEIAALPGFSNHVFGTTELGLSAPVSVSGRMRLLVPDVAREHLRLIALKRGRLMEIGNCALPAPITGAIRLESPGEVSVGLPSGRERIVLRDCVK